RHDGARGSDPLVLHRDAAAVDFEMPLHRNEILAPFVRVGAGLEDRPAGAARKARPCCGPFLAVDVEQVIRVQLVVARVELVLDLDHPLADRSKTHPVAGDEDLVQSCFLMPLFQARGGLWMDQHRHACDQERGAMPPWPDPVGFRLAARAEPARVCSHGDLLAWPLSPGDIRTQSCWCDGCPACRATRRVREPATLPGILAAE